VVQPVSADRLVFGSGPAIRRRGRPNLIVGLVWRSRLALAILPIGANQKPGKITRKGGRRPSRVTRSALGVISAWLDTGAPGGWPALAARAPGADRCGARPVRRAAGKTRAPTPPWPGGPKSGRRRPGAQRSPERRADDRPELRCVRVSIILAALSQERRPARPGALCAPLMLVKKFLTPRLPTAGLSTAADEGLDRQHLLPRQQEATQFDDHRSSFVQR
jgi:hypothetical protein